MANLWIFETETSSSIRRKFWLLLGFLAIIFTFNLVYGFYAFFRISALSNAVLEVELPRLEGIQKSRLAMLNGRFTLGEIIGFNTFADLSRINQLESSLKSSALVFDAYIAAFTWGSQSEAFKKSDGGLNFAEWKRLGLENRLIIEVPSEKQKQFAAVSELYFNGFAINAFKAVSFHKKFLRLQREGNSILSLEAQETSLKYTQKARNFFNLALGAINLMSEDLSVSASNNVEVIKSTQRNLFLTTLLVLVLSFLFAVGVIWVYAKKTRAIIEELDTAAKLLIRKDREFTVTNLELLNRNRELNEMSKILIGRDLELSRSNAKLMELDELKSKFVSVAAHQLRTPLTAIKWSLNELVEGDFGKLKKEQEKLVNDTIAANNRLISLINDLLDVSRLEEGREIFKMENQDITSVLREAHSRFQRTADEKGINIDLAMQLPIFLCVFDREKLIIALSNLIDNAIKYTLPGGQVRIELMVKDKKISISVSDTGIGIPRDDTGRVFNRFFRAHNAIMLEAYGSGLGLAVVKEIVEKHGGSIDFTSEEGKGSVFTITLPVIK
ncbi:MAG: HAMP domain-containing sensor histidine kinase [Patescibacteria group bacterium]